VACVGVRGKEECWLMRLCYRFRRMAGLVKESKESTTLALQSLL